MDEGDNCFACCGTGRKVQDKGDGRSRRTTVPCKSCGETGKDISG